MDWFSLVFGGFLILSAVILHFMFKGMRRRDVMNIGVEWVDKYNNSRLSELPLYLLAAVGAGFIFYQLISTLLN